MAQTSAIIKDGILTCLRGGSPMQVVVDSRGWYDWLQTASTFTFHSEEGLFTARKERAGNQRGSAYWRAYCTRKGKLRRAYLGKSEKLTLEQLQSVAAVLANKGEGDGALDVLGLDAGTDLSAEASSDETRTHRQRATGAQGPHEAAHLKPWLSRFPVPSTDLIGREQEVRAVCDLLSHPEVRLLTITGVGGMGKTRLAIQVANQLRDRFADGVCFVDLAPISDPALVISFIAYELGLQGGGAQPLVEIVKDWLRDKQLLLLLDNFEHLLVTAPHLTTLLSSCPPLKILVTSRATLHVQGEQEFAVPPLTLPDLKELPPPDVLSEYAAVALFLRRSQAVKPNFQLTVDNANAVAEICVRLEGLPLTIEMAAARIPLLPPQALLARLSQRLDVLTDGPRDLPKRQQTLRNTLKWSYDLLEEEEQRLFRRLAVFVGGWTLEAVEAVCAQMKESGMSVLDRVTSLLKNSLLLLIEQEGEEPRLQMLMTVREYALECLTASGEMEATRQAHSVYYLALVKEAEPELRGAQQLVWLRRLEQEHDNLRAVMQWWLGQAEARGDEQSREMALQLGGALEWFWIKRGYFNEGWNFLERALAAGEGGVVSIRARALITAARMADSLGDQNRAEALCKESLALYRKLGDTQAIAFSLHRLGMVAADKGNVAVACSLLEEALALRRELGDTHGIAWSLWQLGRMIGDQGEYTRARALFEESLALFRELGDTHGIAWSLLWLAQVGFDSQGDQAAAQSLLEESLMHLKELGDRDGITRYFILSERLALSQGHVPAARSLAEKNLALSREMGSRERIGESLSFLGKVAALEGNQTAACILYKESLVLLREEGYKWPIACGLEGLASVVAVQGEPAWAARLWGAAEALRESIGAPMPPVERVSYERAVRAIRAHLGEKAFTTMWAEGRSMTPQQALTAQGITGMPVSAPTEPSSPPAKTSPRYPADLTAREVEVLRLVARACTDKEIAKQLGIAKRTVNTYLTSIFSKIRVSTRTAAAIYAIDHDLK